MENYMADVKAEIKGSNLILTIPMRKEAQLSKSKKNLVIATTNGNTETDLQYKGKLVKVGINAYIKADSGD